MPSDGRVLARKFYVLLLVEAIEQMRVNLTRELRVTICQTQIAESVRDIGIT